MAWDHVLIKSRQMQTIPALQDTDQYWQLYEVDAPSKQRETAKMQIRVLCTLHCVKKKKG